MNAAEETAYDIRYHVARLNEALKDAKTQNLSVEIGVHWRDAKAVTALLGEDYTLSVDSISREEIL